MSKKVSRQLRKYWQNLISRGWDIKEIAKHSDYTYTTVWSHTRRIERGHISGKDYRDYIAQNMGYESNKEYQEHLEQERRKRPEYKEISDYIQNNLKERNKSQYWLSKQIDVTRAAISKYVQGKSIPKPDILERIFQTFSAPYKTIEDLLKDRQ